MQQAAARNAAAFKTKSLNVNFDLDNSEYRAIQNIGTGAYGVVCSAVHKKTFEKVAIKKIPNAFEELTTAKRTYREIKIMRHFRHENVIGIREILMPRESLSDFNDVYVILDLMESDLHQIIYSQQSVSMEHIRYFLYQILRGLKYVHSANVVHRDLKPSNLLVNENCELKIGDFGMARGLSGSADSKRKHFMTVYVATRWYRAPELLFSNEDYSYAVDMWSVGCIFAEMLGRSQIFPGKNPMHQLTLIIEVLGMPPDNLLQSSNSDQVFNFFHRNFGGRRRVNLKDKYPEVGDDGLDLLSKMLVFNPEDRITVTDALSHPFLDKYHDPSDEPNCLPTFDFAFEQQELSKQQIRQHVGKMILKYQRTKAFAGSKYSNFLKPAPAATPSAPCQDAKDAASSPKASASVLPPTNPGQMLDTSRTPPKDGIFKVPPRPIEDKKTISLDLKSGKELATMNELPMVNDILMNSATVSVQNIALGSDVVQSDVSKSSLLAPITANLESTNCGDIEMKSAHGDQKSTLITPAHSHDIDMKSARGQVDEIASVRNAAQDKDVHIASADQSPCLENSGQKTISDDTKKLIKAALMNSAFKNKMRKAPDKGGGKMPVTALARQREREQMRKQKLRRSQERKNKGKRKESGRGREKAMPPQLLTEEDRNMLERWSKMHSRNQKPDEETSVHGWEASSGRATPEQGRRGSCNLRSEVTAPGPSVECDSPSSKALASISNAVSQVQTEEETARRQGDGAEEATPSAFNADFKSKILSGSCQQSFRAVTTPPRSLPSERGWCSPMAPFLGSAFTKSPVATRSEGNNSNNADDSLPVEDRLRTLAELRVAVSDSTSDVSPRQESEVHIHSRFQEYRSRHYSDRETPSPPHQVQQSPPAYDESIKNKTTVYFTSPAENPKSRLEKATVPSLPGSMPSSYRTAPSPPELAYVIRQLSKSAMEDSLPPALQITPKGDGQGYGLSLDLEDWLQHTLCSPQGESKLDSGPLSASLVSDWLEVRDMNMDDMIAVQQELGLTSPFNLSYLPEPAESPKAKDQV